MMWRNWKSWLPLFTVVILAAVFRLMYLDKIPTAISGDELLYPVTAKSVYLTGHDMTGTWNPWSALIFRYPPNEQQAELPYFLHAVFTAPFQFSLINTKLPFVFLSIGTVILLTLIAQKLFGKTAGIVTGLIASINPWLVVMGRSAYENSPATFFYLLGFYILLTVRSWNILWSFLPFALAFYSYIGTKLIFLPFIVLSSLFAYFLNNKRYLRMYIAINVLSSVMVGIFVLLLSTHSGGSRLSELILPTSPVIASAVNEFRAHSVSSPVIPLLVNKYSVYTGIIFGKLFKILSPQYLFVEGDQFFLPVAQSFFYYIDAVFLSIAALALFTKKRLIGLFLSLFIVLGAAPQLFHQTMNNFSLHLSMMFPFFVLTIGYGITQLFSSIRKKLLWPAAGIVVLFYILNISGFVSMYFFQYPMTGSGDFPMRILSGYIERSKQNGTSMTVYSTRKGDFLKKYLFYTNGISTKSLPQLAAINTQKPFTFDGVTFTDCEPAAKIAQGELVIYDNQCPMEIDGNAHISSLIDGGRLYTIVNDQLCADVDLNAYPTNLTLTDFSVEKLPPAEFCKVFISQ